MSNLGVGTRLTCNRQTSVVCGGSSCSCRSWISSGDSGSVGVRSRVRCRQARIGCVPIGCGWWSCRSCEVGSACSGGTLRWCQRSSGWLYRDRGVCPLFSFYGVGANIAHLSQIVFSDSNGFVQVLVLSSVVLFSSVFWRPSNQHTQLFLACFVLANGGNKLLCARRVRGIARGRW